MIMHETNEFINKSYYCNTLGNLVFKKKENIKKYPKFYSAILPIEIKTEYLLYYEFNSYSIFENITKNIDV